MRQWQMIAGCAAVLAMAAPMMSQVSIATAMLARERSRSAGDATVASSDVAQPATSLEAALHATFAGAEVIFTGEVVSIERTPGAVTVRWRVEDAIAGVTAGSVFSQMEWPGLWADGNGRYQVGQRALVLLHAPSVGGYASPVADGVIPLRGDTIVGSLDLRWLAQHVIATDAARLQPMLALRAVGGDIARADALLRRSALAAAVSNGHGVLRLPPPDGSEPEGRPIVLPVVSPASTEDPISHLDGSMIVGMLRAWQRTKATVQ